LRPGEDLVEADAEEIAEHEFGDRPQAGDRGAGGGAHDRALGIGVSMTRASPNSPKRPLVTPSTPP